MKRLTSLFFLMSLLHCFSNVYASQADENTADWQQIQQPYFTLIFKADITDEAQRVAQRLTAYIDAHLTQLPSQTIKPFPVVLFSNAHVSNGNVGLAPMRSHWYNKPSTFADGEWFDLLAVHEGRHMVQMNQLYDHATGKVMHLFFGQTGVQMLAGLFIPSWYIEGDAVVSETQFTAGGRGRSAAFSLWLRTDWLNHEPYDYLRSTLGTGFDRYPRISPYDLGYFFNLYFQQNYDEQLMDRVLEKTATLQSISFNKAIKNETGRSLAEHFQQMTTYFKQHWQQQVEALSLSIVRPLSETQTEQWRSFYPVGQRGEQLITVEVDVNTGAQVVAIEDETITALVDLPADVAGHYWSSKKSRNVFIASDEICWLTNLPRLTQPYLAKSSLQCWHDENGLREVSQHDKLTSASYRQGHFLAHEFSAQRDSELVLLNEAGEELARYVLPKRSLAFDITASENGWLFVLQQEDKKSLIELSANLSSAQVYYETTTANIRTPLQFKDWILFTSDETGIDQVMAVNAEAARPSNSNTLNSAQQILTRPFGSYFLTQGANRSEIVLADYTAKGQQLVAFDFHSALNNSGNEISANRTAFTTDKTRPTNKKIQHAAEPPLLAVTDYAATTNLWRPHSWAGYYDGEIINARISSSNDLQSADLTASVGADLNSQQWFGSVLGRMRLAKGNLLAASVAKTLPSQSTGRWQANLNILWPLQAKRLNRAWHWIPAIGAQLSDVEHLATAQLTHYNYDSPAFHDIQVPKGVQHQYRLTYAPATQQTAAYADLFWVRRGFSHRQSLTLNTEAQWLSEQASSIMQPSALFEGSLKVPFSLRASAEYDWNLGASATNLGSLLYVRSWSVSLSSALMTQESQGDVTTQTAFGASLKPNVNLLNNANIRLVPVLAAYYKPEQNQWSAYFRFLIGGH